MFLLTALTGETTSAHLPSAAQHNTEFADLTRVSVVVPALNEEENLRHVLPRIPTWVHEVILVDDHCTDGTVAEARRLLPTIRVVRNEAAPGKGNALRAGFASVTGDIIVQLDADGSEAPEEIPAFVGAILAGADLAKGTRFIAGGGTSDMTGLRKWGNWTFVKAVRVLFGASFTDFCYGYNAFRTSALSTLDFDCDGFEVEAVLNLRAYTRGLRIHEVPSFEDLRVHGVGRLRTIPDGWRVLKTVVRERRQVNRRQLAAARQRAQAAPYPTEPKGLVDVASR